MKNIFSIFIRKWLKENERSIKWLAQKVDISSVHLGSILRGKQAWTPKTLYPRIFS